MENRSNCVICLEMFHTITNQRPVFRCHICTAEYHDQCYSNMVGRINGNCANCRTLLTLPIVPIIIIEETMENQDEENNIEEPIQQEIEFDTIDGIIGLVIWGCIIGFCVQVIKKLREK